MKRRTLAPALAAGVIAIVVTIFGATAADSAQPASPKPAASAVVFFNADGMRPDLMERYAKAGAMPTYTSLMAKGVRGENGMQQGFPPNTGVGWYTLATGTWPSEHGSTNNTFFRTGDTFSNRTAAFTNGILQADTLPQAAERAGKTVVSVEWSGGRNLVPALQGPVVDYRSFFSDRGILLNYDLPNQPGNANAFGVTYQRVNLAAAAGWSNVPSSYSPAMQQQLKVGTTFGSVNPDRYYDLYLYDSTNDSTTNYDRVLVVPSTAAKDGAQKVADLKQGDWADVKVTLTGSRAGQIAGFYMKAIDIASDLSKFRLYYTSIARANATYNALGPAGSQAFENTLNGVNFPSATGADYAPQEAGIVDDATYVQQGLMWKKADWAYLDYIFGPLDVHPDLVLAGIATADEFQHQFLALTGPASVNGVADPYYKPAEAPRYDGYIRDAYAEADQTLAKVQELLGGSPTVFATSDHGFGAQWLAVNARKVLYDAQVNGISLSASSASTASNCGAATTDLAKACWAGGTVQIYVNTTLPAGTTYEQVRTAAIGAFQALGPQVVLKIMKKEDLRDVDGVDALHPNRSGDVVVVLKPPYQFDAATAGVTIAPSQFFGQHGYLPDTVDLANNVNMHATFVAGGPGIRHQGPVSGIRAIDVAPTIAFLLDIAGPQNARGSILYQLFPDPGRWKEADILYISDFHGQLAPQSQAADTVSGAGTTNPSFGIGGAAYLKPWFDWFRANAPDGSITLSGGDAVGATPVLSNYFEDKPTMKVLNMLGLSADTLGNHSFDRGSSFLRTQLIPIAQFPYLSANTVFASGGGYPPEWKPSQVFDFNGFKLGVVGFTLPELASLVFPGALDPFTVTNPAAAINAEAAKLVSKGSLNAIVAVGHMGVDLDTAGNPLPSSPLLNLAGELTGVDALLGGHTHSQYIGAANDILVAESPNSGLRFTRVRLTVDTATKAVVYKTADFHKPWDIGVTPDPAIKSYLDDLTAQIAPFMSQQLGVSNVAIPRSDSCGRLDGRLCESLIGDVATDALRNAYSSDFAITNSGGLRDSLTCTSGGTFCPTFDPPPYPITRGSVLNVLPFGNFSFTVQINGAELKTMLENGVSLMPSAQGRFPQVSGLCFTYDIASPANARVTGAVRQAANGTCTGAPVDLTSASTYTIVENDFMANGGDGYPLVYSRGTAKNMMDQDLADYVSAKTPLSPTIQGRIVCTDSNGTGTAPNCP